MPMPEAFPATREATRRGDNSIELFCPPFCPASGFRLHGRAASVCVSLQLCDRGFGCLRDRDLGAKIRPPTVI
jgi:hypothetical protein